MTQNQTINPFVMIIKNDSQRLDEQLIEMTATEIEAGEIDISSQTAI